MRLIIDGYNLLKGITETSRVSERERTLFIKKIAKYAEHKKVTILIAFDGGSLPWATQSVINKYLTVVYVGFENVADTFIISWLQDHKERPVVVISSDRLLIKKAEQLKATSLESFMFWQRLKESLVRPSAKKSEGILYKTTDMAPAELDMLMEKMANVLPKDDEEKAPRQSSPKNPKKQRMYRTIDFKKRKFL